MFLLFVIFVIVLFIWHPWRTVVWNGNIKTTYDYDMWGHKRERTYDPKTGYEETVRYRKNAWGDIVSDRRIKSKRIKRKPQKCSQCGRTVHADKAGQFHCCGRTWW